MTSSVRRVFHSHLYGAMNKRRRRELGLGRFRREEIWRRMAAEEERIAAARWWMGLAWWQRLWLRLLRWLRRSVRRARR